MLGFRSYGQLGNGQTSNVGTYLATLKITTSLSWNGRNVTKLVLGGTTRAILNGGDMKYFGMNYFGQLGLGDKRNRGDNQLKGMGKALPSVNLRTGRKAVEISAGLFHTCTILDNMR